MYEKESIIQLKSFDFSIRIIRMYQWLCKEHRIYSLADQILRSGTSIGSKKEFTAKIGIAYKEALETRYWLRLLGATDYLDGKTFESMLSDCEELVKILGSIQKTAQQNLLKAKMG